MKFNTKNSIENEVMNHPSVTTNFEGGIAFKRGPLFRLYARAATTFVGEDRFYESAAESDNRLIDAIHAAAKIDPDFVLALAYYLRTEMHMRSVPIVLLGECANIGVGARSTLPARKIVAACMQRPDDMTELIAYQLARNKKAPRTRAKIPMMIKNGIRMAFPKFDAYQLAKYNRDASVRLRDVMFITHPKPPNAETAAMWEQLINGTLPAPDTWEVMRSTGKMTWHDVIHQIFYKDNRVNNYMAILRNLRNCVLSASVTDEDIDLLCRMITDDEAIRHSKVLPFRYLAAYREILKLEPRFIKLDSGETVMRGPGSLIDALEVAAQKSLENLPRLPGRMAVAIDISGSMSSPLSARSHVRLIDVAMMMGLIANRIADRAYVCLFNNEVRWIIDPPKRTDLLHATANMSPSGQTYLYRVFKTLYEGNVVVDRLMVFTDSIDYYQMGAYTSDTVASLWKKYCIRHNKKPHLFICDVSGYDTRSVPDDALNAHSISGWSENIFKVVPMIERGESIVDEIKSYVEQKRSELERL